MNQSICHGLCSFSKTELTRLANGSGLVVRFEPFAIKALHLLLSFCLLSIRFCLSCCIRSSLCDHPMPRSSVWWNALERFTCCQEEVLSTTVNRSDLRVSTRSGFVAGQTGSTR